MRRERRKQITIICAFALCAMLLLTGCGQGGSGIVQQTNDGPLIDRLLYRLLPRKEYPKGGESTLGMVTDADNLYADGTEPRVLYLTVSEGGDSDDDPSWVELNAHALSWYREQGEEPASCEALVQFGDEVGPLRGEYGYGDSSPNATVRLSGTNSSGRQQKSYRVELKKGSGTLDGMQEFVLQKSFTDPFRFSNKLAFDLLRQCDALLSTRTVFVHLYVLDLSAGEDTPFVDYGLYTMVEPVNKRYLQNRNLNTEGELYKAVNFDFGRHTDVIMQPTDARYDPARFEELLESRGTTDYSGLIAMLDAVNDETIPIRQVVEEYFDTDSLYSWLAFNLLLDNQDTDTENFYLYRPLSSGKFYIIPWDFDGILRGDYERARDPEYSPGWHQGIFLYSESKLFRRMMEDIDCTDDLSVYMTQLHDSVLSAANVQRRAEQLSETVRGYLYADPDKLFARVTEEEYERLLSRIGEQIDENFYTYYDTLETPWPFHILTPEQTERGVLLRWEETGALEQSVRYTVDLDDSWDFASPILSETDCEGCELDAGVLPPGQYFVRVTAISESGYSQEAFETYYSEKKTTEHGVLCFYVR